MDFAIVHDRFNFDVVHGFCGILPLHETVHKKTASFFVDGLRNDAILIPFGIPPLLMISRNRIKISRSISNRKTFLGY